MGLKGYVGIEYDKSRVEPGTPSPRVETWTGEGAVSGHMGYFGFQGDLKVADYNTLGSASGGTVVSPTVHVYERNSRYLVGGWAGWEHDGGANLYGLGGEAQAYMGGATLYGSVGYGHTDGAISQDIWAGRLEGRYFVTENAMLNVHGGLVQASADGAHTTVRQIGAGGEYQPGQLPFSIRADYTHSDASGSSAASDAIRVGLRWNFDGGTLAQRDRQGATLNNVSDLFLSN